MKNFKFMKPYPLFKVEYEEVAGRNDSKSSVYRIYVKIAEPLDWKILYVTTSLPWAEIALKKLRAIFELYIIHFMVEDELYYPMFEINGAIYKTQYTFPNQSCVCGEQIAGNQRYTEFSLDYEKFDYVRETVFFYEKGTCLVKGNQLFIDGNLIYNSTELKSVCDVIGLELYKLDSSPDKLIEHLNSKYKDLKMYTCNGYASFFNGGD